MTSTLPDLKPLYLDGTQALTVHLDGPALKVTGSDRCPGRYPLRRLSRVIVSGRVEWDTPALVADQTREYLGYLQRTAGSLQQAGEAGAW